MREGHNLLYPIWTMGSGNVLLLELRTTNSSIHPVALASMAVICGILFPQGSTLMCKWVRIINIMMELTSTEFQRLFCVISWWESTHRSQPPWRNRLIRSFQTETYPEFQTWLGKREFNCRCRVPSSRDCCSHWLDCGEHLHLGNQHGRIIPGAQWQSRTWVNLQLAHFPYP